MVALASETAENLPMSIARTVASTSYAILAYYENNYKIRKNIKHLS